MVNETERIVKIESELTTHEAVCAERYAKLSRDVCDMSKKIGRLELILISCSGAVIAFLAQISLS